MVQNTNRLRDAYDLIVEAIDVGVYGPGDRLVESELAERFGVSRTPVREALQRLETQAMLVRDGRSLIVASLDHRQLSDLYAVRAELEGLAAQLAAKHATPEEVRVLFAMIEADRKIAKDPNKLARANRRFHHQLHLASHNNYLISQLDTVHQSMVLLGNTSLAADGRGDQALDEHVEIVEAIKDGDQTRADEAVKKHLSYAFEMRLKIDAGEVKTIG
ncbi:MAG: GntR family transcriptional regulator [Pseudomonadota bacterium]